MLPSSRRIDILDLNRLFRYLSSFKFKKSLRNFFQGQKYASHRHKHITSRQGFIQLMT